MMATMNTIQNGRTAKIIIGNAEEFIPASANKIQIWKNNKFELKTINSEDIEQSDRLRLFKTTHTIARDYDVIIFEEK